MPRKPLDQQSERLRAEEFWDASRDSNVPLDVASAMAFHRLYGGTRAIRTPRDYDDALNLTAAALSRLIPVYSLQDPWEGRKVLAVDLASQAFERGATRLRSRDGSSLARLTVLRSDLLSAVAQLRQCELPFALFLAGAPMAGASAESFSPRANRLLGALPEDDYAELAAHMEPVQLRVQELLYTEGRELRHVYFPVSGVISQLYITRDGAPTEIAVIGNDGVVGLALLLGGGSTPRRAVVQIGGLAYRVPAEAILSLFHRGGALHSVLLRYVQALITQMSQTAVCNRHHPVEQRLCRWLLFSLDRVPSNEVGMTQEQISHMLGVRRAAITQSARALQQAGLIGYTRGRIIVPERSKLEAHACECYAVVKKEVERLLPPHREIRVASS